MVFSFVLEVRMKVVAVVLVLVIPAVLCASAEQYSNWTQPWFCHGYGLLFGSSVQRLAII